MQHYNDILMVPRGIKELMKGSLPFEWENFPTVSKSPHLPVIIIPDEMQYNPKKKDECKHHT